MNGFHLPGIMAGITGKEERIRVRVNDDGLRRGRPHVNANPPAGRNISHVMKYFTLFWVFLQEGGKGKIG
jgi:hypothetical protein